MHSSSSAQTLLESIHNLFGDKKTQYQNPFWLKTPFENNIWDCGFPDKHKKIIDFNITLSDGVLLTNQKHSVLLNTIKYFLCVHTHSDATGGKMLGGVSAHAAVCHSIHIIDYFLLNPETYQLHQHGLMTLTENDLTNMLLNIGACRPIHQSVYQWSNRLTHFLKIKIAILREDVIYTTIKNNPDIKFNEFYSDEKVLNLTKCELLHARVWLFVNDFYHLVRGESGRYQVAPNAAKLANFIYPNTLGGKYSNFKISHELCISKIIFSDNEYKSAPVHTNRNLIKSTEKYILRYYQALRHLGILQTIGMPVPHVALQQIKFSRILELLNLNKEGRFCLLPSHVVLKSLKNAIEFYITYGNDLIDSYLSVIKAAHTAGKTMLMWRNITPYLTPPVRNMGVTSWAIEKHMFYIMADSSYPEYYSSLRKNTGLWELILVLYGAIQLTVGTLMARRQGELIDLYPTSCLDETKRHLIFYPRKSGCMGIRERIARPIPSIAAKMIESLERLQIELKNAGIINRFFPLFAYPHQVRNTLVKFGHMQFNRSMDFFCDYTQTAFDKEGRRYYIRQHQLRRFFAMLFFWGSSFGGMDTLRWFLAHTDVEHLYHYITESTPGSVLRGVQAHYASEQLQSYDDSATALSDLLEKKFGTRKFDLMSSDELDGYIKNLIDEGSVRVEPEFFNTDDGNSYRILIKVIEKTCIPEI